MMFEPETQEFSRSGNGSCAGRVERIEPGTIAFDIDGVIADTMSLFIDIARDVFQVDGLRYEDITSYTLEECLDLESDMIGKVVERLLDGSFDDKLKPIPFAPEVVGRIGRSRGPVLFVTARPSPEIIRKWLSRTLPLAPGAFEVFATGDFDGKIDVLNDRQVQFFVEDRLETCFSLADAGITPIVFRQPWNRQTHPFCEVGGWKEIEGLIDFQ
jgi:5'(3')-deoxyribonucleotidase